MFLLLISLRLPHLVTECAPLLPLSMLVMAGRIEAGVESAGDVDMRELAAFSRTVRTVSAHGRRRMSEWAVRVGAIGEELAV